MSENKSKALIERLVDFQDENIEILKTKSAYNDNYRYSPLEEILPIIRPFLTKHGIGFFHYTGHDNVWNQSYLETTFFSKDNLEDKIVCRTNINEKVPLAKMNEFMVIGSAITYFRRYHIVTTLGLTTDEDTDAGAKDKKQKISSRSVEESPEKNEVDYVLVFQNQIKAGKNKKSITATYTTYKKLMSESQANEIELMISKLSD
jgi:hypothetical protein